MVYDSLGRGWGIGGEGLRRYREQRRREGKGVEGREWKVRKGKQ